MEFKSKNMQNAVFLISFAIILMFLLDNIAGLGVFFRRILSVVSPFIIGAAMAFIMNNPMMFIERTFFSERSPMGKIKNGFKRPLSYVITLILFVATILIVLLIIIPELVNTIQELTVKLPEYWKDEIGRASCRERV